MKINGQQPPEFQGVKGGNSRENQKNLSLLMCFSQDIEI